MALPEITPLQRAAWLGDAKTVRKLLKAGAEIEEGRPDGLTPLMYAAKEAKPLAVRELLNAGADVNAVAGPGTPFQGESPLGMAVGAVGVRARAIEATVRLLLQAGARVDHRDKEGWTTLINAAAGPRGRTVELLLAAGANPNARSRDGASVTPLIALARALAFRPVYAQIRAVEAAVRHLLQAGALVDRRDSEGWTALLYAAAEPRGRIVGLLLAAGADPNVRSRDGVTPLTAMEHLYRRPRPPKDETTRLLLAAGAKMPKAARAPSKRDPLRAHGMERAMTAPQEPPPPAEYAPFYREYIEALPAGDILGLMRDQMWELGALRARVSQEGFAYAEGKWTVRQVVGHLCDTERVFGYRAFRFAHSDPTPLPGFDENSYVVASASDRRTLWDLVEELLHLRNANLCLFSSLDEEQWRRMGTANSFPVSVRALAYIIVGHARHHLGILRDRYGIAP